MERFKEVVKTGIIHLNASESVFLDYLQENLKIKVNLLNCDAERQLSLELYFDKNSMSPYLQTLYEDQLSPAFYMLAYNYAYSEKPKDELGFFSRKILELFAEQFHYHLSGYSDCFLILRDFQTNVIAMAKSLAYNDIFKIISKRVLSQKFKVILKAGVNPEYYLVLTSEMYKQLSDPNVFDRLHHEIFIATKKFDKFNFIEERDIQIKLFDKDKTTAKDVQVDPRDWLY